MEAVSASKMRKAQKQVTATRPYAEKARDVLSYIARLPTTDNEYDPLIHKRESIKRVGILLVTGDRGLAGGFNSNVLREASNFMRQQRKQGREVEAVTVGRKGRDWLLRYDPIVRAEFQDMSENPSDRDIAPIARLLIDDYLNGHFDEVYLVYTDFVNTLRQEPVTQRLLPIEPAEASTNMAPEYIFEPSAQEVLSQVLIGFTQVQILQAIYESIASEHSARMVAMRNATEAADELVDSLTLTYNKVRQEGITSELIDIIGGSMQ